MLKIDLFCLLKDETLCIYLCLDLTNIAAPRILLFLTCFSKIFDNKFRLLVYTQSLWHKSFISGKFVGKTEQYLLCKILLANIIAKRIVKTDPNVFYFTNIQSTKLKCKYTKAVHITCFYKNAA